MKKTIITLIYSIFAISSFAQLEGNGSYETPFKIHTLEDFLQFRDTVNNGFSDACADLLTDIDLENICYGDDDDESSAVHWLPIGEGNNGAQYSGRFNGCGHIIKNLYVHSDVENFRGLFGKTHNATILNTGIEQAHIHGGYYVGGLVGNGDSTTIINCYTRGYIRGYFIGGIIGNASNCTIANCYSNCATKGNYHSAIIGYSAQSKIEHCLFDPTQSPRSIGYGEGSAMAMQPQQFNDGCACLYLNEFVENHPNQPLFSWQQDSDSLPTFCKETNNLIAIRPSKNCTLHSYNHHIYISSPRNQTICLYATNGHYSTHQINQGINDLGYFTDGIYIIQKEKIVVK